MYHPTMAVVFDRSTTIRLRPKNQITIPEALARRLGVQPGDRLFVRFEEPNGLVIRPVPKSYAGAFADIWPSLADATAEIRAMRDEWDERERRQLGG